MLRFLFGGRKKPDVKIETQRETFSRLVAELNEAIDALPDKPRVTIDPRSGHILPEAPEHFPDEALALPSPEPEPEAASKDAGEVKTDDAGSEETKEVVQAALEADGGVRTGRVAPVMPGTPVPSPPKSSATDGANPPQ